MKQVVLSAALAIAATAPMTAQYATVRPARAITLSAATDSNTPIVRLGVNQYTMFSSTGDPMVSQGRSQTRFRAAQRVALKGSSHSPMWIESAWLDETGAMYAWYHYERIINCGTREQSVPAIGALLSNDSGASFTDLGLVLESWEPDNCAALNGYFAGGHGDFTVIPDRAGKYFYFHFGNYGGEVSSQGVAVARMAIADRDHPIGRVWKYYEGAWNEPGIGGRQTPIYPAAVGWESADTDSFWGPSVHWNTHLERYVMLLNRSCCWEGWPQEGVYVAFAADLNEPGSWTPPVKIAEVDNWYPQVIGSGAEGSDTLAGQVARMFVRGNSEWEIVFSHDPPPAPVEAPQ
ncbi:MAG: hypothetical protein R2762_30245 [Bryobacteraceae bacterium]